MDVAYYAHIDTCTQDFWSASEDGASCQQRYSSVIRRRVVVASAMFTGRAGIGSTEAQRAGAEAQIEAKTGSAEARRCDSGEVHCHFIAPAPPRKHQALSALCQCQSRYHSSIRSACA